MAVREAVALRTECGLDAASACVGEHWGGGIVLRGREERAYC